MNVFRGLCKDRLAFIKASYFLPRWAAVCLLLVGVFLAKLVLLVLLITIITANVNWGLWDQLHLESIMYIILTYPQALKDFVLTYPILEIKKLMLNAQRIQGTCLNSRSQNLNWLLSSIFLVLHYQCFQMWPFHITFLELSAPRIQRDG